MALADIRDATLPTSSLALADIRDATLPTWLLALAHIGDATLPTSSLALAHIRDATRPTSSLALADIRDGSKVSVHTGGIDQAWKDLKKMFLTALQLAKTEHRTHCCGSTPHNGNGAGKTVPVPI